MKWGALLRTIFTVERHDQVLPLWRSLYQSGMHVAHVDFHCDLRGLLINRRSQRAYRIWDRFPEVDEGNYLTHAVLEGLARGVRWIHDEPGGRQHDLKTVKHESDVSALAHRCWLALRNVPGTPIRYEVMLDSEWPGPQAGEVLDIDWDFFASREYGLGTIAGRVRKFLSRKFEFVPEDTFVCYSPQYVHPTRELFERFVGDLAARFKADLVKIPEPTATTMAPRRSLVYQVVRRLYHRAGLALRRRGVY